MKRIATKACACACALALAASGSAMIGCSGSNSGNDGAQQGATSQQAGYTFTDDLGNQVTVSTHERVVAGMGSFANIWELAGSSARPAMHFPITTSSQRRRRSATSPPSMRSPSSRSTRTS